MMKKQVFEIAIKSGVEFCPFLSSDLVFDFEFRKYCAENYCGNFGMNYSCPPACESPAEFKSIADRYENGLLFRKSAKVNNLNEIMIINKIRNELNVITLKTKKELQKMGIDVYMIGSSACQLCNPCYMKNNKPCPFPDDRYSCMSAFCVNVKDISLKCGMDYDYDGENLYLFSALLFNV